jgi:hypothetical protein
MAIKRVGIKNSSGVYEYTDIAVDGSNVEMASGNDLETDLSSMKTNIDNKVAKVEGKGLSTEDYTSAEKDKLSGIEAGAQANTVTGVKGDVETSYRQGQVNITPANIGAAPVNHAASALTYGGGTADNYGHVKLSDNYKRVVGRPASLSIGASERAIIDLRAHTMPDSITAGAHNSIWRGEELLSASHFGQYENALESLARAVGRGDFNDIYVGDTITVTMDAVTGYVDNPQTVIWVVMGINTYYNNGTWSYSTITENHLVLVPKDTLGSAPMNSSSTTGVSNNEDNASRGQAYVGSDMFNIHLPAYKSAIKNSLGGYILEKYEYLTYRMDDTIVSGGFGGWQGASTDCDWTRSPITLLNEVEVYGTRIASSSMFDVGNRCMQLPGFSLNPALKIKGVNGSNWWLSAVANRTSFVAAGYDGNVYSAGASQLYGIVPRVLFSFVYNE